MVIFKGYFLSVYVSFVLHSCPSFVFNVQIPTFSGFKTSLNMCIFEERENLLILSVDIRKTNIT